jgi:transcriptional regulator with XRE-family HTH domain
MENDDIPGRFGRTLRRLRLEQGISQEQLASRARIDRAYTGWLERGQRNPSLTTLARVARGPGIRLSELLAAVERES